MIPKVTTTIKDGKVDKHYSFSFSTDSNSTSPDQTFWMDLAKRLEQVNA